MEGVEGELGVAVGEHGVPELDGDGATEDGTGAEHLAGGFGEALEGLLYPLTDAAAEEAALGEGVGGCGGGSEFGFVVLPVEGDVAPEGGLADFFGNHLQHQGMPIVVGADALEDVPVGVSQAQP